MTAIGSGTQLFTNAMMALRKLKNKSKKVLRLEITEMLSAKEAKLDKDDLIAIWQQLNKVK